MADTKTSVVIKYSKPGAAPPIYLAGSFPESVWQPQEMDYTNDSDHYVFSKAVEVEEGKEYQYKFRIGNGDWWMSDEDAPTVTDEGGNQNNLLTVPVKPSPPKSTSNEKSQEENSTPRTIPDFDTKPSTMETVIEPTQHTESEEKLSESPHPKADTLATDSTLDHGAEVKPEKAGETHDASTPVAEVDQAVEPESEPPAEKLDLSSVPVEELEVSTTGIDEPEKLESHAHSETDNLKNTEVHDLQPNSSTQEASEVAKESTASESNVLEPEEVTHKDDDGLHAETELKEDEAVKPGESIPMASEKSDLNEEQAVGESEVKEEAAANKDEVVEHQEDPVHITSKEPESEQEPHASEGEAKEDTVLTHMEEPTSKPEQHASKGEAKEETGLPVSDTKVEKELTHEPEISTTEIPISHPPLADESTENVAEEPEKEESQNPEVTTSNATPGENIEGAAESLSSAEQVVEEKTDDTPKQEHTISEPIVNEEPTEVEVTTSVSTSQQDVSSKANNVDGTSTIELPADEAVVLPEPNNEIRSASGESHDQEAVEHDEVNEHVDSTKSIAKDDEQSNISTEVVSAPTVTVEKVDSEPRLGDDFGSTATFAQKDAHNLHAQDAVPDHVTIRQQSTTPDLANVAAEVADSAALLDETPPTPPMSDKDAGKIGYRRLSNTPIPEVADTAAEVADSAALIDENYKPDAIDLPSPQPDSLLQSFSELGRDLDIETPFEERAPLFAHECNGPPTTEERLEYESAQNRSAAPEPLFQEFDPNDPSLEPFPNNLNQILQHVRRLSNQLSEDQTDRDGAPVTPVTNGNNHTNGDLVTPSPRSLAQESSPSLLPIVEENAEGEPESKLTALPPSVEKSQSDGNISDEQKIDSSDQKSEVNDDKTSDEAAQEPSQLPTITTPRSSSPQPQAIKLAQASSKLHPVLPALPLTPFVENRSLNLAESSQVTPNAEIGKDSPSITVQPATPAENVNAKVKNPVSEESAAKTTSFAEENGDSQLRARKQPTSSAPDRSITPSSMRSAGDDAKSRNFLRAFFQVVFVDWIGGLIRKLCGGGRHTLVAVPALLIVVTAPVLYLSGLANFGFGS
ncbi:ac8ac712-7ee9-4ddd-ab06-e076f9af3e14 [Sclerotinia trifoliorum]|uniref:Ac8ac712-7ee9-4ddd-ab06-e076f9af3e14 n=1 Tax=Sclerotinia trifoliorum TaxID=28548 RepID=A0A8H2VUE2_9HELO|nr:ac8ac712-7ee9-4ddd-ab06-e076f9af3e14 [Sclerotinia trifoliorum]